MGFKSLFTKLSICVTLCMIALGTALVGYASRTARREAYAKAQVQLQMTAQEQAEALHRPLATAMAVARNLAQVLLTNPDRTLALNRAQDSCWTRRRTFPRPWWAIPCGWARSSPTSAPMP
jgi:hypothetical protein